MSSDWIETLGQDVRYALRSLRASPVLATVAVLSLALGLGATTAVFTLANVMLLAPLPYPHAERLVVPYQTIAVDAGAPADTVPWTFARYERLRELVPAFEDAGFATWQDMNVVARGEASRARVEIVTASLFTTLGIKPMVGRAFAADDDSPGVAHTAALISYRLWRRQLGGGAGTTIDLDGAPVTVIGIMPDGFSGFAGGADVWVPLHVMPRLHAEARWVERLDRQFGTVIARVRVGTSDQALRLAVAAASVALDSLLPERTGARRPSHGAGVMRLAEARRHPLIEPLLLLLGVAVGAVMLIVCANLAGLLLARARARQTEIGVRLALGAGRGRIARQVLTESVLLAALGAVPGLVVAYTGATTLARLRPRLPQTFTLLRGTDLLDGVSLAPDWRVLLFAATLTLAVGFLFGAAPAIASMRTEAGALLTGGGRGASAGGRGRRALVVGQVALATALLVGAGLMVRSLRLLLHSDLGFDPVGVVVMRLSSSDTSSSARVRRAAMLERVERLPGVEAAATSGCIPFDRECFFTMPIAAEGAAGRAPSPGGGDGEHAPEVEVHIISPAYLRVMRIPLREGRGFDSREARPPISGVILSQSAARRLWGAGVSAIGRRVSQTDAPRPMLLPVVGVARDTRFDAIDRPAAPALYFSGSQMGEDPAYGATLFVRTRGDMAATLSAVRREVRSVDPMMAVYGETTMDQVVRAAASSTRFVASLLGAFALTAALLAALGVYGVLAFMVTQRTREFGIRIAIGATPGRVVGHVVRQGATLTAIGLGVGVVGAFVGTGVMGRFLYGVERTDVPTYAIIVMLVGVVGLVAAVVPAMRATRVDPAITLKA